MKSHAKLTDDCASAVDMSALATHASRATQHLGFEPRAGVSPACNAAECSDTTPRSNPPTETAIQPAAGQATARSAVAYGLFTASTCGFGTSVASAREAAARCSSESWACTRTCASSSRTHPSGTPTPSALSGTVSHRRACSCLRLAPAAEAATRTSCASGRVRCTVDLSATVGLMGQARLTAASGIVRTGKSLLIGQGVNNSCRGGSPRQKEQEAEVCGLGTGPAGPVRVAARGTGRLQRGEARRPASGAFLLPIVHVRPGKVRPRRTAATR